MADFLMPSLGADMEAGTLAQWLVEPGAKVKRGDVIAVVETQKGAIDIEVFEGGTLSRILVEPGTEVPVGTPLAYIDPGSGEVSAKTEGAGEPEEVEQAAAPGLKDILRRISPAARRRAQELGVDVDSIPPPAAGVIGLAEVEAAAHAKHTPTPPGDTAAGMREAIARAMSRSKREIPHYYLALDVDAGPSQDWLAAYNAERPVTERMLYGVLLVKAVGLALKDYPDFNGFMEEGVFKPSKEIDVGVAVALRGGGLVAPAIHAVDTLALPELMTRFADLVNRVRGGHIRGSEMSDPTVTVTSLGEQGVDAVFPIIYPPQVAIVGFGSVSTRAWVVDGKLVARAVIRATLAADHRVSDGHRGARFLARVAELLARPEEL